MSLVPLDTPIKTRSFLTFDLEWRKGEAHGKLYYPQVSLVGVYDGQRYRHYVTVSAFLEGELTHRNRGRWFYAHAGGLADMIFVLETLLKSEGYKIEASFSGSSAIIVRVMRGKSKWVFVDSYWLLRDKLANLAKFVEMEKGDVDFEASNMAELIEYNELDCVILWRAISRFEMVLKSLGGQLQMTLASCSMFLFRSKYLKRVISTSPQVNAVSRQSYVASRVEIFSRECEQANYYDINSSFPYAMTFKAPGNLINANRTLPDHDLCLADCEIEVPPMHLPPLAYRAHMRVYFPYGKWRAWFTGVDLRLLQETGGKIIKVHECLHFAPFDDLRSFATDLYDRRLSAPDAMQKLVLKLLLNSLYGKFGESSLKTSMICFPDSPPDGESVSMLMPGVFLVDREAEVAHAHVPISAHITAKAREVLYDYMRNAGSYHYCDTDGFATNAEGIETGNGLGALKLEMQISRGRFYRPKVYELHDRNGIDIRAKAKGFSLAPDNEMMQTFERTERDKLAKEHTYNQFTKLVNGHSIENRRFYRIRELLRTSEYRPTEARITKGLQREIPKREFSGDGSSVPWNVAEIQTNIEHFSKVQRKGRT